MYFKTRRSSETPCRRTHDFLQFTACVWRHCCCFAAWRHYSSMMSHVVDRVESNQIWSNLDYDYTGCAESDTFNICPIYIHVAASWTQTLWCVVCALQQVGRLRHYNGVGISLQLSCCDMLSRSATQHVTRWMDSAANSVDLYKRASMVDWSHAAPKTVACRQAITIRFTHRYVELGVGVLDSVIQFQFSAFISSTIELKSGQHRWILSLTLSY